MLFSTVHDEFSLKTSHLVPQEDIRHKNYFKMLPKEKRIDLEQEKAGKFIVFHIVISDIILNNIFIDPNENGDDDENDDEFDNIRTRFRVSFID